MNKEQNEDRSKWTYADWLNKDPMGIIEMAKTDERKFYELRSSHYNSQKGIEEAPSSWTYADWMEKDPKGLGAMAENQEDRFKALFKQHSGKDI